MKKILEIKQLNVKFLSQSKEIHAVRDISFDLLEGETIGIIGESGCGKSTLAKALLRLFSPDRISESGLILYSNKNLMALSENELLKIRGAEIGLHFQDASTALNPSMRIGVQLIEGCQRHLTSLSTAQIKQLAEAKLFRLGFLQPEHILGLYPYQLSGGMAQRVLLAMVMLSRPKVLIADEPTSSLDEYSQQLILKSIKEYQRETGCGVIFITHDLALAAEICDRMIVMKNGQCIEEGPTAELISFPKENYTQSLIQAMQRLFCSKKPAEDLSFRNSPFLELKNLAKNYSLTRLDGLGGIDLQIYPQEMVGLVGPSGSGKTTLAKLIVGIEQPTQGLVVFKGKEVVSPRQREICRDLQIIFQNPGSSLNPKKKVFDVVAEPLIIHNFGRSNKIENEIEKYLGYVGLSPCLAQRYPHELSGGERQRVAIARALILRPQLLVCDEITCSLDLMNKIRILDLLCELQRRMGMSILFISHEKTLLNHYCNRILEIK